MLALIALPVAAMVAGASLYRTTQISQDRQDVARMGRADLLSYALTEAELRPYLPSGSTLERAVQLEGRLVLDTGRPFIDLRVMRLDGLAEGMLTLLEGRAPTGPNEVAISATVAALAGTGLGGTVRLDGREPATVVGLVENPMYLSDRAVVLDPAYVELPEDAFASWLIDLPDGADPAAIVAASFEPGTEVQEVDLQARGPGQLMSSGDDSTSATILILGALALIQSALIASAAFAVSIRRRQRELGLLAATGATPRQLAQSVLLEAGMLGLIACVTGVAVGVVGVLALTPWLDQLTEHRNGSLVVDGSGILGPITVGFTASIMAAVVPALTASRMPVLLALSGRRPAQTPARRTLWVGLVAITASIAMTGVGATMRDATGNLNLILLIGGAVLGTLGFGATSPWLLERLESLAGRLPVSSRIAFRDTARARSRSSPIVTAVLCALAAAVAIGAYAASRDAESLASWSPSLHTDELVIIGPGAANAGADLRQEPGVVAGMEIAGLAPGESGMWPAFTLPDAHDADGELINLANECGNCNPGAFQPYQLSSIAAPSRELLKLAHAEAGAVDLQEGRVLVLTARAMTATTMDITFYDDTGAIARELHLPVRVIATGVRGSYLPEAFLPDAVIRDLGLASDESLVDGGLGRFVVQYDHAVTDTEVGQAQVVAANYPDTEAFTDSQPTRPGEGFRLLIIGLVLLFAVSVTGIAIALGEAESRPEQRSLLALGADPGLRRRIAASRAAVLALLAGILAVPAGLLPVWGIFVSRGTHLEIPTFEIAGAVLVLPLVAVLGAFVLSRPIPEWNAFRNVRPGD